MPSSHLPAMQSAAAQFFSAKHFAIAGASSETRKFGHRIFAWYLQHDLPAVPMNPNFATVQVSSRAYNTVSSPSKVSHPRETSLSVITPPPVTAKILKEAKESGIMAVWLQPGSFTDETLVYALENWPGAAIGGFADGTVGGEGWCVLVDGDQAIEDAERIKLKRSSKL
ncbi:hypothetical protein DOTSEDRAFT_71925 [Dothistroma septosporum NZE10]|uniref:CoA-binding domain-containing protein n=1 Tax=Dothistroma septosporum (strain NZE10 / CBS 128990) TaxID=675120 RepID=N1PPD9_DOTSN|nr:hypothetical protein DOTSEDRAFT_71925 [Dothistroma septosporum NZE10]